MRQEDVLTYRMIVGEIKSEINRYKIYGGLLLAGAMTEGSGLGWALDQGVNNGNIERRPEDFMGVASGGTIAFLLLLGGSAYKFLEARWEKDDNQGNFELLERLESGECVPLHYGGGSD